VGGPVRTGWAGGAGGTTITGRRPGPSWDISRREGAGAPPRARRCVTSAGRDSAAGRCATGTGAGIGAGTSWGDSTAGRTRSGGADRRAGRGGCCGCGDGGCGEAGVLTAGVAGTDRGASCPGAASRARSRLPPAAGFRLPAATFRLTAGAGRAGRPGARRARAFLRSCSAWASGSATAAAWPAAGRLLRHTRAVTTICSFSLSGANLTQVLGSDR